MFMDGAKVLDYCFELEFGMQGFLSTRLSRHLVVPRWSRFQDVVNVLFSTLLALAPTLAQAAAGNNQLRLNNFR